MHVLPEKYGPTTWKRVGPESPVGDVAAQISSSPNAIRFGTPVPLGSGAIHWLYQDWIPGQYCIAQAVPFSAEPEAGSATSCSPDSISVQLCPKSEDT